MDEDINKIASNSMLSEFYVKLAKELEVLEPKSPEDVYKSHLENKTPNIESAK